MGVPESIILLEVLKASNMAEVLVFPDFNLWPSKWSQSWITDAVVVNNYPRHI